MYAILFHVPIRHNMPVCGKVGKKKTVLGCSGFSCSVKKVKVKDGSLPWIIQEVSRLTRASGDAIAGISIRV